MPYPFVLLDQLGGGSGIYPLPLGSNLQIGLVAEVLSRLNQQADSALGQLTTGSGSGVVMSTTQRIIIDLNDAVDELCRTCYPLADMGSYNVAAGQRYVPLSKIGGFAQYRGGTMWAARSVVVNGVELDHYSRSAFELWFPSWRTAAQGTPTAWYDQGEDGIALFPVPAAPTTIVVDGVVIPAPLVNPGDTTPFLRDINALVVWRAAQRFAEKNVQIDPDMAERIPVCKAEWEEGTTRQLARLYEMDRELAEWLYPMAGK